MKRERRSRRLEDSTVALWIAALSMFCFTLGSTGFGIGGFVVLLYLVWGLATVICRSRQSLFIGFGTLVLSLSSIRWQRDRATERGDELVLAIEAFEQSRGRLPESLDELAPHHIPAVSNTGIGLFGSRHFGYVAIDSGFDVSFSTQGFNTCRKSSSRDGWRDS